MSEKLIYLTVAFSILLIIAIAFALSDRKKSAKREKKQDVSDRHSPQV